MRFRLWHLFSLIVVASAAMWIITQAGMVDGEIEIERFEFIQEAEPLSGEERVELTLVKFKYTKPRDLTSTHVCLFMEPIEPRKIFNVGTTISFRYRDRPVFGLKTEQPLDVVMAQLGITESDVEEIITEVVDR